MPQTEELKIENDPRNSEPISGFRTSFEKMTKDMTFVGTYLIVYGFISCLTIVGLPVGIPVILAGLKMREAADQFSFFRITNNPA